VFENRVLRKIFGPKRDEVTGEWRRLHNEDLNDLYSSPNIIRVIKSRRMRWAGHIARMGEGRVAYLRKGGGNIEQYPTLPATLHLFFVLAIQTCFLKLNILRKFE
jgi:hypothetical protein